MHNVHLQYLEGGWVQTPREFHHLLLGLPEHVVTDILLVSGQLVGDSLHVGPLVLTRGHWHLTTSQFPGEQDGKNFLKLKKFL